MARQEAKITRQALEQLLRQYVEAHAHGDRVELAGLLRYARELLAAEAARHGISPEELESAGRTAHQDH